MADQSSIHTWLHHTGSIWENATAGAHRRQGPGTNYPLIDNLQAGQPLIILCYAEGESVTFTAANGQPYTSAYWDFVVTGDQDPGGYVADVLVNTGGSIERQLGAQGSSDALRQRLTPSTGSNQLPG